MQLRYLLRALPAVACVLFVAAQTPPVAAHGNAVPAPMRCAIRIDFGAPTLGEGGLTFRGTATVDCPQGRPFSLSLRSAGGCAFNGPGGRLRYDVFADAALARPVVSCTTDVESFDGAGRQSFLLFGRIEGASPGAGRFTDSIVASIRT